jgi:hypothetical protein
MFCFHLQGRRVKMGVAHSSETLVNIHWTAECHISEGSILQKISSLADLVYISE